MKLWEGIAKVWALSGAGESSRLRKQVSFRTRHGILECWMSRFGEPDLIRHFENQFAFLLESFPQYADYLAP